MNTIQLHCSRIHRTRSQTNTHPTRIQNYAASTYTGMEKELQVTGLSSMKYQINPYNACSSENTLTRTTAKSVMPSKPLPSNPLHEVTSRFWTEEIAELVTQRIQTRKRVERDPTNDTSANYNTVEAHVKLLTKHCKADKLEMTCKDIDLSKEGRKAWNLLHELNGEIPKQRVRR